MTADEVERGEGALEIGAWRVEPGLNQLSRGEQVVALEPRAMDLLVLLARHAGETVSKEALLQEVWKGAFVVEGVISKTVSGLRAALGDDAATPSYILTVARRGYRLVAPVRTPALAPVPPAAVDPTRRARELDWPPQAPPQRSFALDIPSPRPARSKKALAAALGAGLVLVAVVGGVLTRRGQLPAVLSRDGGALPDSAERQLLEARYQWSKRTGPAITRANDLLLVAAREAPRSAEVQGWLALSFVTRGNYLGNRSQFYGQAQEHLARALELDPESAIAHCARGVLAINQDLDAGAAITALARAVALDPRLVPARQYLAEALSIAGRDPEALAIIESAIELEPVSPLLHAVRGLLLLRSGRPAEALEAYDRALVLEPTFVWLHRNRAFCLARLGRERDAIEAYLLESRAYGTPAEVLFALRSATDREGMTGYWRFRLEDAERMLAQGERISQLLYAEALAGTGRLDDALVALEQAKWTSGGESFFYYRDSPAFDALRDDPRFRAIYSTAPADD